ncbi:hypothetical protein [Labrys sp. 22185]|uniref:hypothetical protein n=1 Tax=Labrys sp. 22185 TaxID=3453888 RepID=UPI003F878EEC
MSKLGPCESSLMKTLFLSAAFLAASLSFASAAPLETYTARLSSADHFNTNGERLTSVAAIIRQDRANFYLGYHRDREDEPDRFFSSKENRARLESMLNRGRISASAADAVINGSPLINVEIYEDFIAVTVE